MKNFGFACLAFLIWAFFSAWVHATLHPLKTKTVISTLQKQKPIVVPVDIPVATIKNTPVIKPNVKDTISKTEVFKETPTEELIENTIPEKLFPEKIIYLITNQNGFDKHENITQFIDSLQTFLTENDSTLVNIIGHTDTIGDIEENQSLGLEYAGDFEKFLISKGIPKNRIQVFSKGETEPLPEDRKHYKTTSNSRIEIIVKPNTND